MEVGERENELDVQVIENTEELHSVCSFRDMSRAT